MISVFVICLILGVLFVVSDVARLGANVDRLASKLQHLDSEVHVLQGGSLTSGTGQSKAPYAPSDWQSAVKQINDHMDVKFADHEVRIKHLEEQITRIKLLEDQMETFKNAYLGAIGKGVALSDKNPSSRRRGLLRARTFFQAVKGTSLTSDSELIQLRRTVAAVSDENPRVSGIYWQFASELVNYPFLNNSKDSVAAPIPKCPVIPDGAADGVTIFNCELSLDGYRLKNVRFVHVMIRYRGGPVTLTNVTFDHCHFEMLVKRLPKAGGREFGKWLLASNPSESVLQYKPS